MSTPKISIIVPVYKTEKYIRKCLDSIQAQTFTDWECILVDDGSPDSSGQICDEYSALDERFVTLHKPNGGVSDARNKGIETAKGDWMMFIDADDIIASETLETSLYAAKKDNLDIVQFSSTRDMAQLSLHENNGTEVCSSKEYIAKNKMLCSVWGNLIKSCIICDNNIRFDKRMKLGEDQLFIYACITKANKIQRISNILYYYYDNPGSATHNEKIDDIIYSSNKCIDFKQKHPEFALRMDGLVLWYIGKLLLHNEFRASHEILFKLQPSNYKLWPWQRQLVVKISHYSISIAIVAGSICYKVISVYSMFKRKLNNIVLCRRSV